MDIKPTLNKNKKQATSKQELFEMLKKLTLENALVPEIKTRKGEDPKGTKDENYVQWRFFVPQLARYADFLQFSKEDRKAFAKYFWQDFSKSPESVYEYGENKAKVRDAVEEWGRAGRAEAERGAKERGIPGDIESEEVIDTPRFEGDPEDIEDFSIGDEAPDEGEAAESHPSDFTGEIPDPVEESGPGGAEYLGEGYGVTKIDKPLKDAGEQEKADDQHWQKLTEDLKKHYGKLVPVKSVLEKNLGRTLSPRQFHEMAEAAIKEAGERRSKEIEVEKGATPAEEEALTKEQKAKREAMFEEERAKHRKEKPEGAPSLSGDQAVRLAVLIDKNAIDFKKQSLESLQLMMQTLSGAQSPTKGGVNIDRAKAKLDSVIKMKREYENPSGIPDIYKMLELTKEEETK